MTNKYLEKIAKVISEDEKKSRSRAWGTLGRTVGGSALGSLPGQALSTVGYATKSPGLLAAGSAASLAGGVYGAVKGYKSGIKKHAPHVPEKDRSGHAGRGYLRAVGRGYVEGTAGAAAGAGVGAGVGALAHKFGKGKVSPVATLLGAVGGGYAGMAAGLTHGAYKSTKNKLDELNKKKSD